MSARRIAAGVLAPAALVLAASPAASVGAHDAPLARAVSSAPVVQSMVVGVGGAILSPARQLRASATTVAVGRRRCAVAGATPLAVLAALRRAGGPSFALHDYGRCGRSTASSGQLFVSRLGGEANRAQDGWEYKVDGEAGATGAADPSGPRGDGRRLRAGARVLWFWCQAQGAGCQRSLEVLTPSATVAPGASVVVTVRGRDNEGRASAVGGAIVTLGSDFASTDASGSATLIAPAMPGAHALGATRSGLVPSFPGTIVVR